MYNISFTNYVQRATRTEKGITAQELGEGKQRLIGNIEQFTPQSICFMGKKCCQHFLYRRNVDFGYLENFTGIPIFCLPSSSGRAGSITETEKTRYYNICDCLQIHNNLCICFLKALGRVCAIPSRARYTSRQLNKHAISVSKR
jgi:G:T/U-mismatch repair DNA glycosylase